LGGSLMLLSAIVAHINRTLCMCDAIAAIFRPFPIGGSARQAASSRFSSKSWFASSLIKNEFTTARFKSIGSGWAFARGIRNPDKQLLDFAFESTMHDGARQVGKVLIRRCAGIMPTDESTLARDQPRFQVVAPCIPPLQHDFPSHRIQPFSRLLSNPASR